MKFLFQFRQFYIFALELLLNNLYWTVSSFHLNHRVSQAILHHLNLVKYHLNHLKPVTITSFSIVLILPITVYILFAHTPFLTHMQSFNTYKNEFIYVFILGILSTSIATLIFYNLIKIKDTVFASTVTYLMPIVAVVIGILDGETVNLYQLSGMGLIILGVYINSIKK